MNCQQPRDMHYVRRQGKILDDSRSRLKKRGNQQKKRTTNWNKGKIDKRGKNQELQGKNERILSSIDSIGAGIRPFLEKG